MKNFTLFVLLILLIPNCYAEDENIKCTVKNYTELVLCAENYSSEIKIYNQQLKTGQKLEEIAEELINPDLDIESVRQGSDKIETSATLFFNIRLGEKSKALKNEARQQNEKNKIENEFLVNRSRLDFMLNTYRLSHLQREIDLIKETSEIYAKIIRQYSRRVSLTPEQSVSLSVFNMAIADQKLKLLKFQSEQRKILKNIESTTQISPDLVLKYLPPRKDVWPKIENVFKSENSLQVRQARADLNLAKAQLEKAQSEAWPDLKIGPTIKSIQENGESSTLVGVGVSIPLPILNQSKGQRAFYSLKKTESEMQLEQAKKKINASRFELLERYNQIVFNLKNSLSSKFISSKHNQIETQFFKGLVPSSLVIEAHRQLQDFEENRNASELEAIESLGQILITDNSFSEVIL